MRFFDYRLYRYFLTLCLIGVIGLGGAYYVECINNKSIEVSADNSKSVYASGKIVGIYEQTAGVLVVDSAVITDKYNNDVAPSKGKLKSGDYITAINGIRVSRKEDIIDALAQSDGEDLLISYIRGNKKRNSKISPVLTMDNKYAIGLWVKDDMAGIGTITCYDSNGRFCALGHGIGDGTGVDGKLLSVQDGCVYDMDLSGVTKGEKGIPGEISGIIYYGGKTKLGDLDGNNNSGIRGSLDKEDLLKYKKSDNLYIVAKSSEIRKGKAYILSEISGEIEKYEIKVLGVDDETTDDNKGIYFKVIDEELINQTGGIVQGMSGSPIIQDGKIIGAVTHVLVNDPTKGYGIFIEKMLKM